MFQANLANNMDYNFLSLQPIRKEDRRDFFTYRCDDIEEIYAFYLPIIFFGLLGNLFISNDNSAFIPAITMTLFNFIMRLTFYVFRKRWKKAFIYHLPVFHLFAATRFVLVAYLTSYVYPETRDFSTCFL